MTDLGLLADRPAAMPSIRAPLDIVRDSVASPGWTPLLLSTHQVSSYKGLVEVFDYIAFLSNHKHPIVPILVDEKIHKRCLKLLYSDRTQHWYCPWQSGTSTMERHWEAEPDFPSDPYSEPDVDTYRTVLTDVLRTFLRQPRNFPPAVIRLMDNKVALRSDAQRTNILDTILALTDAYNRF